MQRRETVDRRRRWRKDFLISYELPKIGLGAGSTEVTAYQDRAGRAEQWLHRIYTEAEERFLRASSDCYSASRRSQNAGRRVGWRPKTSAPRLSVAARGLRENVLGKRGAIYYHRFGECHGL